MSANINTQHINHFCSFIDNFGLIIYDTKTYIMGYTYMQIKSNRNLVPNAKKLRKEMTKEERHLWYDYLRDYPMKFNRQKILGKYIVDFYCAKAKLVVELDGSQHFEEDNIEKDNTRTMFLEEYGLTVLRVPNSEVNNNFRNVCEYIDYIVKQKTKECDKE